MRTVFDWIKKTKPADISLNIKQKTPKEAARSLFKAKKVLIVPGFGLAAAKAQDSVKKLLDALDSNSISTRFVIHPVAGRMQGHMNFLLEKANIPYNRLCTVSEINSDLYSWDVVLIIGANDITNPAANKPFSSPISGMQIVEVGKAKEILFIKRSLASGYSGLENELFYKENAFFLLGDAKIMLDAILKEF